MYTGDYMKKSILKVDPFRVFVVAYSTHLSFLIKYTKIQQLDIADHYGKRL